MQSGAVSSYGSHMGSSAAVWSMRLHRRLESESDLEILMAPLCVILSLGVWNSISGPGRAGGALGLVLDFVLRNRMKTCSAR